MIRRNYKRSSFRLAALLLLSLAGLPACSSGGLAGGFGIPATFTRAAVPPGSTAPALAAVPATYTPGPDAPLPEGHTPLPGTNPPPAADTAIPAINTPPAVIDTPPPANNTPPAAATVTTTPAAPATPGPPTATSPPTGTSPPPPPTGTTAPPATFTPTPTAHATFPAPGEHFVAGIYNDPNGVVYPYQVYVPAEARAGQFQGQPYPLVLSLHGNGLRGTDNQIQLTARTVTIWHGDADDVQLEPTFILAPQAPPDHQFLEPDYADALMRLLDLIIATYPINTNRLYINGYSMGASSTLELLRQYPNTWAAAGVISGLTHDATFPDYQLIVNTPLWVFAAEDDPTVPFSLVAAMMDQLWLAGGYSGDPDDTSAPDLRFTVFPAALGLGHWTEYPATHHSGYREFFYSRARE